MLRLVLMSLSRRSEQNAVLLSTAILVSLALMALRITICVALGASIVVPVLTYIAGLVILAILLARMGCDGPSLLIGAWAIFKMGCLGMGFLVNASYHVGRIFPMADDGLAAIDRALEFDWVAYLRFAEAHYWLNDLVLHPAYLSIFWQPLAITVWFVLSGSGREPLATLLGITVGLMLTSVASITMPAYGAYHHFNVIAAMHPHLANLETGDGIADALDWLRRPTLVGEMPAVRGGLVTFPSFHTTAAFIFMWACRRSRPLLAVAVPLNLTMLFATPLHGSHYLADMGAGALVAVVTIVIVEALLESRTLREMAAMLVIPRDPTATFAGRLRGMAGAVQAGDVPGAAPA